MYQGVAAGDEERLSEGPRVRVQAVTTQSVNPETFRIIAYVNFWLMVLWAMLITKLTVDAKDISDSALYKVFGYNNICVYWDYNPSIWTTALVYPAVEFPLLIYVVLNWLRTKKAHMDGLLSDRHYRIATVLSVLEFLLFAEFRMIFVNRAFENISGHTAPFTGFQLALTLNAIQNLLFYGKTDHTLHVYNEWQTRVGKLYLVLIIIVTAIKQCISWLAICKASTKLGVCDSLALNMEEEHNRVFAETLDRTWMVLLAIVPFFIAIYTRRKSASLQLNVNLVVGNGLM